MENPPAPFPQGAVYIHPKSNQMLNDRHHIQQGGLVQGLSAERPRNLMMDAWTVRHSASRLALLPQGATSAPRTRLIT
jgi:hypothetical protein